MLYYLISIKTVINKILKEYIKISLYYQYLSGASEGEFAGLNLGIIYCQDDEAPQGNSGWQIYEIFDSLIT